MNDKLQIKGYNFFILIFLISFITYLPSIVFFNVPLDGEGSLHYGFLSHHGRWFLDFVKFGINKQSIYTYNPYLTILISNVFLTSSTFLLVKIFKLNTFNGLLFSTLYITFPQYAYQYYFITQTDIISLGLFLSSLSIYILYVNNIPSYLKYIISAISLYLILGIYQTLLILPLTILFIKLFLEYEEKNNIKNLLKKVFIYFVIVIFSIVFYYITIKILKIDLEKNEYASSFFNPDGLKVSFKYFIRNLLGKFYYGQQAYLSVSVFVFVYIIYSSIKRTIKIYQIIFLLVLLGSPFFMVFLLNSYPPRIFLSTNLCFAFLLVYSLSKFKLYPLREVIITAITFLNMFYISQLYYSQYKVGEEDKTIARDIKVQLMMNVPDFYDAKYSYYFYGRLKNSDFRIKKAEVFGASFFEWCGGDSNRISCFLKYQNILNIKPTSLSDVLQKVNETEIQKMPTWPNPKSIQKFDRIIIVKLGEDENQNCLFSLDE